MMLDLFNLGKIELIWSLVLCGSDNWLNNFIEQNNFDPVFMQNTLIKMV
jgi:hypothetical protein